MIAREQCSAPDKVVSTALTEDKSKPEWITSQEWALLTSKSRVHIRAIIATYGVLGENYIKLKAAALMAREELVFGGDWKTARAKIDNALFGIDIDQLTSSNSPTQIWEAVEEACKDYVQMPLDGSFERKYGIPLLSLPAALVSLRAKMSGEKKNA